MSAGCLLCVHAGSTDSLHNTNTDTMAASRDASANMAASSMLQCPMCNIPFDTEDHEPKLLLCHHSFCLACLEALAQGRPVFRCPDESCRKKNQVPAKGVQDLKTNFYVAQMRSLMTSAPTAPSKPSAPKKPPAMAPKPAIVTDHAVEHTSSIGDQPPPGPVDTCQKHFGQPLLFFCETCLVAICMNCTVLDHDRNAGHQITDVAAAAKVHHQILRSQLQRMEDAQKDHSAKLQLLRAQLSHLEVAKDTCVKQLQETFSQLLSKIEQRRDLLVEASQQLYTERKQALVLQGQNLKAHTERLARAQQYIQDTIDSNNINAAIKLAGNAEQMAKIENYCEEYSLKSDANFIQFDYAQGLENFIKSLSTLTNVACDKPLPAKTIVEFPNLTSSVKAAIKVILQDCQGQGLSNYPITAHVTDPCTDALPCKLVCREEGIYALQIRPQMPGKHKLQLKFMDKPLWNGEHEFIVQSNNPVLKIGEEGSGAGEMYHPTSVTLGPHDSIYVADMGNKRIQIYDADGKFVSQFKVGGSTVTSYDVAFNSATEDLLCSKVATNEEGHVLANTVRIFGPQGEKRHQFSHDDPRRALFVTVNSKGHIITTDSINNCMYIFSKEGNLLKKVGELGNKAGQFNFPSAVCVSKEDTILVSDTHNHRVQVFTKSGKFLRQFGGEGHRKGQFRAPRGLASDAQGNILVADSQNRIQVFRNDGSFLSCIDSLGDKINEPYNMAATKDGHVLVADFKNNCVKKYRYQ